MKETRQFAKYLAGLGYGSRKEMEAAIARGHVRTAEGKGFWPTSDWKEHLKGLRIAGDPLDPPPGMFLMLNKPVGFTCSRKDEGRLVYELLPPRFALRSPALSSVGRLDANTSGLILFTDDGQLLHKLISPKSEIEKTYDVMLARPLEGHEGELFASGELVLRGEEKPLKPARLDVTGKQTARLTLTEGRYHQVRRMFAAAGNHVEALHRSRFGALDLGDLAEGAWRLLETGEISHLRIPSP